MTTALNDQTTTGSLTFSGNTILNYNSNGVMGLYNAQTINQNIVVPTGSNMSMVGPVTIGSGSTITVQPNSRMVVL
jgi:bifunctional N-acetylglucosamine-1-phosphate-uridyltransferase/glucosamine-1-phosphate-acetyltransferase GlmU-like protein